MEYYGVIKQQHKQHPISNITEILPDVEFENRTFVTMANPPVSW